VEQGSHIVVGTPGRLIDVINKGKVIQFVFNASGSFTTSKHEIHNKGNKALFKLR
jgi:hypothetical protein